jgi:ABC-2 type transport system ATP-binding protein
VSAALSVRALAKRYGALQALRDVSFDLRGGELLAVVGPNGAGKTTLLSIVAGSTEPSSGSFELAGGRAGWAPQRPAVYLRLSVRENLELFAHLERLEDPRGAAEAMLEQTGLGPRAEEPVARLSGGNRQRVNVALALIGRPSVLALDEPTAALDPGQRERLWEFIEELVRGGAAVLYSTHNVSEVARHARRVLVLDEGTVRLDGSPAELLRAGGEPAGGDLERALVRFLESPRGASDAAGSHAGERDGPHR